MDAKTRALTVSLLTCACANLGTKPGFLRPERPTVPATHRLTVAVLPFVDGRTESTRARNFRYRSTNYRGTRLNDLSGDPMVAVSEAVARRLVAASVFERIVLVDRRSDASDVDLFLSARVQRARGYVEDVSDREDNCGRRCPIPARVLGEVALLDVQLVDGEGVPRFRGDTGWAIDAEGLSTDPPWAVLSATLDAAVERLAEVLRKADYVGVEVPERVALRPGAQGFDALTARVPTAWSASEATAQRPTGWSGPLACDAVVFTALQSLAFNRALGPYVPTVHAWRCPADIELTWERDVAYPARPLGRDAEGRWLFVSSLGKSNWSKPMEALEKALPHAPLPRKHVFQIPPRDSGFTEPPLSGPAAQ